MKSQSLKLFAIAFVLGLVAFFGAHVEANAQTKLKFETSFDFHLGKDRLPAGKYELKKISYDKYVLKSVESGEARIVLFGTLEQNPDSAEPQRVTFNRYGDTYFLRSIFEKPGADGKQIVESKHEKRVRTSGASRENQLAGEKRQPEKVSVNLKN